MWRKETEKDRRIEANLYTFFYTLMIWLQNIHVAAKNFTANCLSHIILFNIFAWYINCKLYISGTQYIYIFYIIILFYVFMLGWPASWIMCIITNSMNCCILSLLNHRTSTCFGLSTAHHQKVLVCICGNWYIALYNRPTCYKPCSLRGTNWIVL
jgi:hypothetical protein